jgi:hypothetical protein
MEVGYPGLPSDYRRVATEMRLIKINVGGETRAERGMEN